MLAFVRKKLYSILEREYRSFLFFIFSVVFSLREYIILASIPSNVFLCNITYDQVFCRYSFRWRFLFILFSVSSSFTRIYRSAILLSLRSFYRHSTFVGIGSVFLKFDILFITFLFLKFSVIILSMYHRSNIN